MLDDDTGGLREILDALQRGIRVGNIVIGQLLALQLPSGGDTGLGRLRFNIEGISCILWNWVLKVRENRPEPPGTCRPK